MFPEIKRDLHYNRGREYAQLNLVRGFHGILLSQHLYAALNNFVCTEHFSVFQD